jgi:N-acetylglucosamine-6-sulfatase
VRRLGALILAVIVMVGVSVSPSPRRSVAGTIERPNVVLVVTDDQRFDTLWAMPEVRRRLVARGVTFRETFVVNPACCPSRASILTGSYSHSTGVYRNGGEHGGVAAFDATSTLATWFQDAGYRTALIGKYLNGYSGTQIPPGWTEFDAFNQSPEQGLYYDYTMNLNGSQATFGDRRADYSTRVLSDLAATFVSGTPEPFFLYLAPRAPHAPATPDEPDRDAFGDLGPWRPASYDEADVSDKPAWARRQDRLSPQERKAIDRLRLRQYRSLLAVDRMVARLVGILKEDGRLHDTVLVFTSDNGVLWGEHRLEKKGFVYEESIRAPLVIRYDRLVSGPLSEDSIALNIDLAPTLAELAGVAPATAVDGRSLVPVLDGSPGRWRNRFLVEHLGPYPPTFCAVRSARHVFAAYDGGAEELYALASDPAQLENLAGSPDHAQLRARMLGWMRDLCDPPPPGYALPAG